MFVLLISYVYAEITYLPYNDYKNAEIKSSRLSQIGIVIGNCIKVVNEQKAIIPINQISYDKEKYPIQEIAKMSSQNSGYYSETSLHDPKYYVSVENNNMILDYLMDGIYCPVGVIYYYDSYPCEHNCGVNQYPIVKYTSPGTGIQTSCVSLPENQYCCFRAVLRTSARSITMGSGILCNKSPTPSPEPTPSPTFGPFPIRACDSAGWKYYDGFDIFGHDLSFAELNRPEDCILECNKRLGCYGYSWTAHNENPNLYPRCYFKTIGATQVLNNKNVYSGYRCDKQTPEPSSIPKSLEPSPSPTSTPSPKDMCFVDDQCNGICVYGTCSKKCNFNSDCFNGWECTKVDNFNLECIHNEGNIIKPSVFLLLLIFLRRL